MVKITLQITKVIWNRPQRGAIIEGAVIECGAPSERKARVVVPGFITSGTDVMCTGQWWRIAGEEVLYLRNRQIAASAALMVRPEGEHIVDLFAADKERFRGIGRTYAIRLYGEAQRGAVETIG